MHWLSGTGHVLWANETELNVLGYTAEEYIGQVRYGEGLVSDLANSLPASHANAAHHEILPG